jgi:hypothetical protein
MSEKNPYTLPRRGGRRRKVLLVLAALAVLFFVVHTAATFAVGRGLAHTVDELEDEWGDLSLSTLVPPPVPRMRNRTPLIRAALELVALEKEERSLAGIYGMLDGSGPEGDEVAAIDGLLERHRLAFELLAEASERPESNWYIPYRKGVAADLPPLLELIQLSRLNLARAMRALERGDTERALETVEQGFAMTDSFAGEPVLIVQLIRISCDRLNTGALRALVARADLDDEALARLQRRVDRMASADPIHTGLLGEMKSFYHELDGITSESFGPDDPWIQRFGFLNWLLRPLIRADTRFYLRHMGDVLAYQERPAHERGELLTAEPRAWHLISRTAIPNLENAVLRGDLYVARARLARTALALHRYRSEHGSYPDALARLVPGYLEAVPSDPLTGEAPRYAAVGEGYRLYSPADGEVQPLPEPMDQVLRWEEE